MELKIFFDSVDEQLYENILDESSFFRQISVYGEKFPDWQRAKIAIVGLCEERGNRENKGAADAADAVRQVLYRLKSYSSYSKIVDLGNLRNGITHEETLFRIREITEALMEKGLFVVFIGGTNDLALGQYLAYEKLGKMVSIAAVDALLDLNPNPDEVTARNYLNRILTQEPNYLFHVCHFATQSFLNDISLQEVMEKLSFENVRLGQMRDDFTKNEPLLRMADMLFFDIGAIKKIDAPGNVTKNVFGLTAEEACQLAWYAGMNDKLTTAGIYEFNPSLDLEGNTAFVVATMVWYLIDGFNHRKGDLDFNEKYFTKYIVNIGKETDQTIVFYKSRLSEKWWMEVPYPTDEKRNHEQASLVPCSYSDYETAVQGELPNRWVLMHGKLF